ncbi:MAG: Tm-1-like ATP-binding domain-containing protein, partial [Alphaproteobacteria bacterium]
LPIGVPKLMVSTLASGDVGPFVGVSDIAMMYSVADIAGLNSITRVVLANAGRAAAGMAGNREASVDPGSRPAIGLTMFGVTTTAVTEIARQLGEQFDGIVFHATGTGGRAMEKLVDSGMLTGVIDATTTEIADHLVGGVLSAGDDRLGAIARTGVPYVGSVGALDMVNFWAFETVPESFTNRLLHRHNPNVTLMRTSVEECTRIGAWMAARFNQCAGPVRILLPEKGISALDAEGQVFYDPDADAALFEAIEANLVTTADRTIERLPHHINDTAFATAMAETFRQLAGDPTS